jgi:predicted secreted hydrolase
MRTEGTLSRPGAGTVEVAGWSWFDREIATNQLDPRQVGWDWFAIQLDSGETLMLYQMRLEGGGIDSSSHGKWVPAPEPKLEDPDFQPGITRANGTRTLTQSDYSIRPLARWTSPQTGIRYPTRWEIEIPSLQIRLVLSATLKDQEMQIRSPMAMTYWEGSHRVTGTYGNQSVSGRAYVELTGYGERLKGLSAED